MLYSCLFERNQPDLVVYLYMFDHDGIGSQLSLLFFFLHFEKEENKTSIVSKPLGLCESGWKAHLKPYKRHSALALCVCAFSLRAEAAVVPESF